MWHAVLCEKGVETDEKVSIFKDLRTFRATPKPWVAGSNPPAPAIIIGQKRSDRENKRKREISRDFSRFSAPTFFQSFIDPFSGFHRVERNELWIEPFFPNLQSKTNDRKDLNPRQGFKFFRYFALDTNCLQTNHYKISPSLLRKDPNPRNLEKLIFQKQSIVQSEGFEPTNTKYWPAEDKEKAFCIHSQMLISQAFGFFYCRKDDNRWMQLSQGATKLLTFNSP